MRFFYPRKFGRGIIGATIGRGNSDISDNYSAFNICHYVADDERHIEKCRNELAEFFRINDKRIISLRQTHSDNILLLKEFSDTIDYASIKADGLVTNLKNIVIGINTADCVPVLLADVEKGIIAAVHAGRRGVYNSVVEKSIKAMSTFGATSSNVIAYIQPSILGKCYEVGDDIYREFSNRTGKGKFAYPATKKVPYPHIDLPRAVKQTLIDCGLRTKNIKYTNFCTHCNPNQLFSARRHGINSGRNFSFIANFGLESNNIYNRMIRNPYSSEHIIL